ncbi:ADP-ribosylation factor-related protein 1 [Portunus trituberculatus]|uniref:ADP-ribosylation factor-related protein 1 n=1 Tax=Portunus trituberculatus TaxID=210409 RepID=A0A5B7E8J2_PORTR|nr:ADP-ribosylation factor-related protein 1 [Portunus trituberculatus]
MPCVCSTWGETRGSPETLSPSPVAPGKTYLEAAKTKFTRGYKGLNPSKITTTVGQNVGGISYSGIKLSFWDLGGQEELQPLWEKYYAECHAIIYMVDSADRERMEESKEAFVLVLMKGLTGWWSASRGTVTCVRHRTMMTPDATTAHPS